MNEGEEGEEEDEGAEVELSFFGAVSVGPLQAQTLLDEVAARADPEIARQRHANTFSSSPSVAALPDPSKIVQALARLPLVTRASPLSIHVCALGTPPAAAAEPALPYQRHVVCQLGVIDLLQRWDGAKQLESAFKTLVIARDAKADVSAVEPVRYAARLVDFASAIFDPVR